MLDKIKELYLELESWLIQTIDSDSSITNIMNDVYEFEKHMMETCPVEYAIYTFLRDNYHM